MKGERRKRKVRDPHEVMALFEPGMGIAIGGMLFHNRPVAIVRELIRKGVGSLTLYSAPLSSYDVDLLVGAG